MKKIIFFVAFLILLQYHCYADRVIVVNGDRLTGNIIESKGGMVVLKTDYAGVVKIKLSDISDIHTTRIITIRKKDDGEIRGKIITKEGDSLVVETEGGNLVEVPLKHISAFNPKSKKWEGNITIGAGLDRGNTDRLSASVSLEILRQFKKSRINTQLIFNYSEEEGNLTARNLFGSIKYDYFLSKKYFAYLATEVQSDTFRDLNLGVSFGPGFGYQLWNLPDRRLSFEGGFAYLIEDYDEARDKRDIMLRLSGYLSIALWKALKFVEKATFWPDLEKLKDFHLRNEASLITNLSARWSLKVMNIIEYRNLTPENVENTDMFWITGFQYSF